jgi:hypothetical protein
MIKMKKTILLKYRYLSSLGEPMLYYYFFFRSVKPFLSSGV